MLRRRDRILRRSRRHHRTAGRRAGRRAVRRSARPQRSGDRDQPHAEPRRLHRRLRHRARSRRDRHRQVSRTHAEAGEGRVPLPGEGDARFRRDAVAVPGFRAAAGARRQERPVAGMAAEAADRDRPAPDQCAGRHHQLHHLSTAAGRCMCSTPRRCTAISPCAARKAGEKLLALDGKTYTLDDDDLRDRRRQGRRIARRHHGRRDSRAATRTPPTC